MLKETVERLMASTESPLVSIIVLNWNGEHVIRLSLDSIKKLEYPNTEMIIVDNGSTDSSVDIIRKEYPEFRLIENGRNLGFSAGMNVGIEESRGDLILLCNNDAIAHPKSLSQMVKTMHSDQRTGIVGGVILYYEPKDVIWSAGGKLDAVTGMIWSDRLGQKLQDTKSLKTRELKDVDYLSGCVLLIKRAVLVRTGLLDEESVIGGQDVDLCLKARRAGFNCVLNSGAKIWHIGSYSSRQTPIKSYAQRQKSDFRVILLHFPLLPLFSALFSQLFLAPLFENFFFAQSEATPSSRFYARLTGLSQNLENIRGLLSKRKQIAKLGSLRFKIRIFELLRFAIFRLGSKEFFMGGLLKKPE